MGADRPLSRPGSLVGNAVRSPPPAHLWWGLPGLLSISLAQGIKVARRDGLSPSWRLGGLIGLLTLLQPVAREAGRLRSRRLSFRWIPAYRRVSRLCSLKGDGSTSRSGSRIKTGTRSSKSCATGSGLSSFRRGGPRRGRDGPGLRFQTLLAGAHGLLRPVGRTYLRLGYELRLRRLVFLALAVVVAGVCTTYFATGLSAGIDLWWPGLAALVAVALVGGILAERLFGRRMHRALVTDHATAIASPGTPDQLRQGDR